MGDGSPDEDPGSTRPLNEPSRARAPIRRDSVYLSHYFESGNPPRNSLVDENHDGKGHSKRKLAFVRFYWRNAASRLRKSVRRAFANAKRSQRERKRD